MARDVPTAAVVTTATTRLLLDCDSPDRFRHRRHSQVESSRHFASVNQWWLAWVWAADSKKCMCGECKCIMRNDSTHAATMKTNRTSGEPCRAVDRGIEAFEWHNPSCSTVCDHERAYPPPPCCDNGASSRLESSGISCRVCITMGVEGALVCVSTVDGGQKK
jgi:hypothetical protein